MIIKTKFFGEMQFGEDEVLFFPLGIYGFEQDHRFVLIYDDETDDDMRSFMWLQSADDENLCFIVIDPCALLGEYTPDIPVSVVHRLGASRENELRYLVLAVIYEETEKSTVNLLSPIVINAGKKIAMQTVLDNTLDGNRGFKTRHMLFDLAGEKTHASHGVAGGGV